MAYGGKAGSVKINVILGDVMVSRVEVSRHPQNLIVLTVRTPLDPHPAASFGSVSEGDGLAYFVDLFPTGYGSRLPVEPTRVLFSPEGSSESEAFAAGMMELDRWSRWSVVLLAIPLQVIGRSTLIAAWDRPAPSAVDYLDRRFDVE